MRTVCAGCGLRPSCRRTLSSAGRSQRTRTPSARVYLATRTRSSMPWRYATVQYSPHSQQIINVVLIYYLNITVRLPSFGGEDSAPPSTNHFMEGKYWLGSWDDLTSQTTYWCFCLEQIPSFFLFFQAPPAIPQSIVNISLFKKHRTPVREV